MNIRGVFVANAMIYGVLIGLILKFFRPIDATPPADLPVSFMEGS